MEESKEPKMEPNKVRVQELTLLYYTVRSLVPLGEISEPAHDLWLNLGAVFAEHLGKLKMKLIGGRGWKKETVGSLLTLIFMHIGIPLNQATVNRKRAYMDTAHLTYVQWLKDDCFWIFRDGAGTHLLELPQWMVTNLQGNLARLEFHSNPLLLRNLANIPHRLPMPRAARAAARFQPETPAFHIPDIPMRDHGEFQRVVVDTLHAIWARVSQRRCVTRGSVRTGSPSATGPSRQRDDATPTMTLMRISPNLYIP